MPDPDPRWASVIGGLGRDGQPVPMAFEDLARFTMEWSTPPDNVPSGIADLLATARSLFAHAWFRWEFMAVACLVSLQAVEATMRQIVLPNSTDNDSFREIIERGTKDGILTSHQSEWLHVGRKLRNSLSHPGAQAA